MKFCKLLLRCATLIRDPLSLPNRERQLGRGVGAVIRLTNMR